MITLLLALSLFLAPPVAGQEVAPPHPVDALVAARAFTLEVPRDYPWMADHAPLRSGLLLAMDVEPALALPRQTSQPVLFVGDVVAERLNVGHPSGRLLVLVPGAPDLGDLPVYFGAAELPENIDAVRAADELSLARTAGLAAFSPAEVELARAHGGADLFLADARALEHAVADWIDAWAPDEAERAHNLRAPSPGP